MILTVDIGNSVVGLALISNEHNMKVFNIDTNKQRQYDQYLLEVSTLLNAHKGDATITKAVIASVVPSLTAIFEQIIFKMFGIKALVVGPGVKTGIVLKVDNPSEVGADIVAVCVAGNNKYPEPLIIIDLGTANKYIYLDEHKVFHGVVISTGLRTGFNALVRDAEQLLNAPLVAPKQVLGKNTRDCLSSGALYGTVAELEGLVSKIKQEVGGNPKVVLTGGNAYLLKHLLQIDFVFEPNLVHDGLFLIAEKN